MQIYKNSVIVTIFISIVSFIASFVLKFYLTGKEVGFWYDISIGVFSGAILTLITVIVGYRVERRKVLEGFWSYTHKILKQINKYEASMTLEKKIDFFIDFIIKIELNGIDILVKSTFYLIGNKRIANTYIILFMNQLTSWVI